MRQRVARDIVTRCVREHIIHAHPEAIAADGPAEAQPAQAPAVVKLSSTRAVGQSATPALRNAKVAESDVIILMKRLVAVAGWKSMPKKIWTGV